MARCTGAKKEGVSVELVADTNVIIAAVLRPGMTRSLVFHTGFQLYSPYRILEELENNKEELLGKSQLGKERYKEALDAVFSNVAIVPLPDYERFEQEANAISPDHKDWPFFAVALQRHCAIWSNEKRLKNQERVAAYNTSELHELFEKIPKRGDD